MASIHVSFATQVKGRSRAFGACVFPLLAGMVSLAHSAEVARVADTPITVQAVRQTIARQGYSISEEASVRKGLEDAIDFELLFAEARRLNFDRDPAIAQQLKQLMVEKVVREKIEAPLKDQALSESELKAWYSAHTNEFTKAASARGAVLTVLVSGTKTNEAKSKALEAHAKLQSGTKFETVVRQYSDDPGERINGGSTPWQSQDQGTRRYPPEVTRVMFDLQRPGEFSQPVQTTRAFYIVSLTEKRPGQTTPFERARNEVQRHLARERHREAYRLYCERLKREFPVTVNESELKNVLEPATPNAGPPLGPVDLK
jgi:hypothetical protein